MFVCLLRSCPGNRMSIFCCCLHKTIRSSFSHCLYLKIMGEKLTNKWKVFAFVCISVRQVYLFYYLFRFRNNCVVWFFSQHAYLKQQPSWWKLQCHESKSEVAVMTFHCSWQAGPPHSDKRDRPKIWEVISSKKWDTALESWNMSKRLGEILLNTASWHLLLSALTRKRLALLTCIFVTQAWTVSVGLAIPLIKSRSRNGSTEELKPVFYKEHWSA